MTEEQWKVFCKFKKELKSKVEEWAESAPALSRLQREAALAAKTPLYPFETTVVYNRALDDLTPEDQIKLIVTPLLIKVWKRRMVYQLCLICSF